MIARSERGWGPAALTQTIARFRERFRIRRAVVVADRGMLRKGTLARLRDHASAPFDTILCSSQPSMIERRQISFNPWMPADGPGRRQLADLFDEHG